MSAFFDDLARAVASPMSRREVLRLIGGVLAAAVLPGSPRLLQAQDCQYRECDDPIYPHPCGDICGRYDYYCADSCLLNGSNTRGVICRAEPERYHLCSDGTHGWCCAPNETCGTERYECVGPCAPDQEECGDACCDPEAGEVCCGSTCCAEVCCGSTCCAEGEICCDASQGLCCPAGVTCCYDDAGNGTCCAEETTCTPATLWYPGESLPGRICCPDEQACRGQCCDGDTLCVGELFCCPSARTNPADRTFCCAPGFVWSGPGAQCCLEGKFCNGECCPGSQICIDGECQDCADGQEVCFGTCCAQGTCCFGKCCGPDQVCTGECTVLESLSDEVTQVEGGRITSSDGAVDVAFPPYAVTEPITVTYTSQQTPAQPLPAGYQLLRSFTIEASTQARHAAVEFQQAYRVSLRYSGATLAAMAIGSEAALDVVYWDGTAWVSLFPCFGCGVDTSTGHVIVATTRPAEFALVARPPAQVDLEIFLPLVTR